MTAQPKPTAAERVSTIREALVEFMADELPADAIEEWFDRWLAEHDAQVAAEARESLLREVRIEVGHSYHRSGQKAPESCVCHAIRRADRIAAREEP